MGATTSRDQHSTKNQKQLRRSLSIRDKVSFDSTASLPVNFVKHQVVLSDYVPPISSLTSAITIPMRRSSWRKSMNTNDSAVSSSFFDDDAISSPRTSIGSYDNKKQPHNTIVFESSPSQEDSLHIKNPSRPFWAYNIGDEKEYDRQLRQHYVLKHVFDGNIHLPIPTDQPITILDSACGAGFWALDMATTYPNIKVIGLDTFPVEENKSNGYANATVCAPNIIYKYGDLSSNLTLPESYFDIIYQRDIIAILPHERWPSLFNDYYRLLKFGGSIEIVEHDFNVKDPGPVLTLINEWYKNASVAVGINPSEVKDLKELLIASGFEDVQKKVVSVPIGEWPSDKAGKENGYLYKQVIEALFKSMKPWWTSELGVSEEEYNKVIQTAMVEFEEQRCYVNWFIYTAKKPNSE